MLGELEDNSQYSNLKEFLQNAYDDMASKYNEPKQEELGFGDTVNHETELAEAYEKFDEFIKSKTDMVNNTPVTDIVLDFSVNQFDEDSSSHNLEVSEIDSDDSSHSVVEITVLKPTHTEEGEIGKVPSVEIIYESDTSAMADFANETSIETQMTDLLNDPDTYVKEVSVQEIDEDSNIVIDQKSYSGTERVPTIVLDKSSAFDDFIGRDIVLGTDHLGSTIVTQYKYADTLIPSEGLTVDFLTDNPLDEVQSVHGDDFPHHYEIPIEGTDSAGNPVIAYYYLDEDNSNTIQINYSDTENTLASKSYTKDEFGKEIEDDLSCSKIFGYDYMGSSFYVESEKRNSVSYDTMEDSFYEIEPPEKLEEDSNASFNPETVKRVSDNKEEDLGSQSDSGSSNSTGQDAKIGRSLGTPEFIDKMDDSDDDRQFVSLLQQGIPDLHSERIDTSLHGTYLIKNSVEGSQHSDSLSSISEEAFSSDPQNEEEVIVEKSDHSNLLHYDGFDGTGKNDLANEFYMEPNSNLKTFPYQDGKSEYPVDLQETFACESFILERSDSVINSIQEAVPVEIHCEDSTQNFPTQQPLENSGMDIYQKYGFQSLQKKEEDSELSTEATSSRFTGFETEAIKPNTNPFIIEEENINTGLMIGHYDINEADYTFLTGAEQFDPIPEVDETIVDFENAEMHATAETVDDTSNLMDFLSQKYEDVPVEVKPNYSQVISLIGSEEEGINSAQNEETSKEQREANDFNFLKDDPFQGNYLMNLNPFATTEQGNDSIFDEHSTFPVEDSSSKISVQDDSFETVDKFDDNEIQRSYELSHFLAEQAHIALDTENTKANTATSENEPSILKPIWAKIPETDTVSPLSEEKENNSTI